MAQSGEGFQRCDPTSRRIYGMPESHPLSPIKILSSRAKSRDLLFWISGQRTHPTAAIPLRKTLSFRIRFSGEESAFFA
jgi:hypothetical protein